MLPYSETHSFLGANRIKAQVSVIPSATTEPVNLLEITKSKKKMDH